MRRFLIWCAIGLICPAAFARAEPSARALTTTLLREDGVTFGELPELRNPFGIWVNSDGSTYIADTSLQRVRVVRPDGSVRTIAGTSDYGYSGDGGPLLQAELANPTDVALDREGAVYIADSQNHVVRKVTASGGIVLNRGTPSRHPLIHRPVST